MGEQRVAYADYSFSVDTETGTVHRLSSGGACLVYRVFSALRDEHWATPTPRTTLVDAQERFVFAHDYRPAGYAIEARTTVEHDASSVRIAYAATVSRPLLRNRLGLCLLLPGTLAGTKIDVTGTHGRAASTHLPRIVEPHQPCTDIASLSFAAASAEVRIGFAGEVFEMEDQRNWTDYSFKIYGTPLALPFPVRLEQGDHIEQSITIELRPPLAESDLTRTSEPRAVDGHRHAGLRMPAIGTRLTEQTREREAPEVAAALDYRRIDVGDGDEARAAELRAAAGDQVYRWTRDERPSRGRRDAAGVTRVRAHPDSAVVGPDRPYGGLVGTDGAFAELNRSRPRAEPETAVVFTASPQVHDRDEEAIVDNLFGLRAVLASVRTLYPDPPFGLGLLELTPHFNPAAGDLAGNRAIRPVDPRLATSLALAWGLAALCEATVAGCRFVTLFDATGAHGFEIDGRLAPATHLIFDLAEAGLTGAGREAELDVALPAEDLGSARRYAMRRTTSPRAVLAANLGPDSWATTAASFLAATDGEPGRIAAGATAWRARVIGPDVGPLAPQAFHAFRRRSLREIGADTMLTLPPRAYLFLEEDES